MTPPPPPKKTVMLDGRGDVNVVEDQTTTLAEAERVEDSRVIHSDVLGIRKHDPAVASIFPERHCV